jgi:hypothetical protein
MINVETLIVIISAIVVLSTMYFSRFYLRNYAKITGEELAKMHPELGSLKFKYNAIQTVVALVFFLFFVVVALNIYGKSDMTVLYIGFPMFLAITVFDGLFELITGVYPTTTKYNWNHFVYDETISLRWIAFLQIGLAIFETIISIVIFQSYHR